MEARYRSTLWACCFANFFQAVGSCFAILYVPLRGLYGLSFTDFGILVSLNFITQVASDVLFSKPVEKYGFRPFAVAAPLVSAAGLGLFAAAPILFPQRPFAGFCAGMFLFAAAGGLQELEATAVGKPAKLGWRARVKYVIWVPWVCSIVACAWIAGGFTTVDPLYGIPGGVSMNSPLGLPIYFGIVALFFVPNLLLGRCAMCHCICWMAPFMVLGEKLGSALRVPQLRIEADPNGCIGCGKCDRACPMSLPVQDLLAGGAVADAECIQCAACADVCPKGVLRLRMGRMR